MLFLKIYIGFSVLTFLAILMQTYILYKRFERKYPDIIEEFRKNNKSGILEKIFNYIKIFITCFVPIVNVLLFFVYLFESEEVERRVLKNLSENKK